MRSFYFFITFICLIFSQANAIESLPYKKRNLSLKTDNDAYFPPTDKDRYYTAGHSLLYTHSETKNKILSYFGFSWLIAKNMESKHTDSTNSANEPLSETSTQNLDSKTPISRLFFGGAQEIRTPHYKFATHPPRSDMPYSGYLYAIFGVQNRFDNFLEQTLLHIGIIGPGALGKETQDSIHNAIHVAKYAGWSYQIQNEMVLNLYYNAAYKVRLWRDFIDIIPLASLALGNAHTHLDLGVRLRIGYNLSGDFGFGVAQSSSFATSSLNDKFRIYLQTSINGRFVARNIFLQGNTIGGLQTNLDLQRAVCALNLGLLIAWKGASLSASYTLKTPEFSTQLGNSNFASFALSFSF